MTNKTAEHDAPSAENLKRAFECAVRDIHEVGVKGKPSQYRTPIVQRPPTGSPHSEEKRALSDAARALAQLWKVSTNPAR